MTGPNPGLLKIRRLAESIKAELDIPRDEYDLTDTYLNIGQIIGILDQMMDHVAPDGPEPPGKVVTKE